MRIGIIGGGIAGLAAAYECELHRRAGVALDWYLYEASNRFGGTVSTTRRQTAEGEYILEDGPDGWLTEKPWAAELALELGLGNELIACNERQRRTLLWLAGELVAMPGRMRLMVPEDLAALEGSPLFTASAKQAYADEVDRAEVLRHHAPEHDESIASFVRRHFGDEVLTRVAAPLLAGVFGGDVEHLSVRAVMPQFVAMERDAGSLVASLQARARMRGNRPSQPVFTSLRRGMGSLSDAVQQALPPERMLLRHKAAGLRRSGKGWLASFNGPGVQACVAGLVPFDHLLLATPPDATIDLLRPLDPVAADLVPTTASSALLVTLCWPAAKALPWPAPGGFGFLVPPDAEAPQPALLAATFAEQKYPGRAPDGARVIRAFFGSRSAAELMEIADAEVQIAALRALAEVLGPLPEPAAELGTVRRWPRSLPQYEVGHLERMRELEGRVEALGPLDLLGNAYRGVGLPDLVRDARAAVRRLCQASLQRSPETGEAARR